jgi:hypothetical protein
MRNICIWRKHHLLLAAVLLFLFPTLSSAANTFGGLTFIGDQQGICIEISGECVAEDIVFELKTCDATNSVKGKFKDRMPFTLLVPVGTHYMLINKDGKKLIEDEITIVLEKVLEYKLP